MKNIFHPLWLAPTIGGNSVIKKNYLTNKNTLTIYDEKYL
jgi:hypothetical protein